VNVECAALERKKRRPWPNARMGHSLNGGVLGSTSPRPSSRALAVPLLFSTAAMKTAPTLMALPERQLVHRKLVSKLGAMDRDEGAETMHGRAGERGAMAAPTPLATVQSIAGPGPNVMQRQYSGGALHIHKAFPLTPRLWRGSPRSMQHAVIYAMTPHRSGCMGSVQVEQGNRRDVCPQRRAYLSAQRLFKMGRKSNDVHF
jgi:hypothetical protein